MGLGCSNSTADCILDLSTKSNTEQQPQPKGSVLQSFMVLICRNRQSFNSKLFCFVDFDTYFYSTLKFCSPYLTCLLVAEATFADNSLVVGYSPGHSSPAGEEDKVGIASTGTALVLGSFAEDSCLAYAISKCHCDNFQSTHLSSLWLFTAQSHFLGFQQPWFPCLRCSFAE